MENRRIQYAILVAFAVHGGLEPDLLDEVTYWIEQYWSYALFAAVAIVRECADRSGIPLDTFVADLATSTPSTSTDASPSRAISSTSEHVDRARDAASATELAAVTQDVLAVAVVADPVAAAMPTCCSTST